MHYRTFGQSNNNVSEIGLGTWQLGGSDWGNISDSDALKTLRTAADQGITFFDTADVYGLGRSEELIGKFLKDSNQDIMVGTKLGRFPEPGGDQNFSLETFRQHAEASLKRLGSEAIDLMQLHCIPTKLLQEGHVFDWLDTLKQEGKIKQYGVSVETVEEAEICMQYDGVASLQIIFNIFRQKPIRIFEEAKNKGIALIVRLPLASGLLAGKYTKATTFAENDHRTFNRDGQLFNVGETFAGLPFEKGVELADALKPHLPDDISMAQMAQRWILDFEAVTTVITGARNDNQVKSNAAVSHVTPLGPELHQKFKEFYKNEVAEHIRGAY